MNRFVKISYTGKLKEGRVFDTTDEAVAKKEGMHDPKKIYSPISVIVGEGQVIAGLDKALKNMNAGQKKTLEIPPEEGYGKRDPARVELIPMRFFKQQNMRAIPGMPVEIDGRHGRIQTVAGGRVRVDFNSPLAGQTIVFDVNVESEAKTDKEKIDYLVERSFNDAKEFDVKTDAKKNASITLPRAAFQDRNILMRKASLAAELFRFMNIETVTFTENWENPTKQVVEKAIKKAGMKTDNANL